MKRKDFIRWQSLGILALIILFAAAALADSTTVSYQGQLRNTNGTAVPDGAYTFGFSIWDALTGGTQLWQETHSPLTVKNGRFSVQLGDATDLGTLFTDHSAAWLEIAVDFGFGYETYAPRIPLTSIPYTKQADNAATTPTATHATAADSATSATNATNATHATSADSATNATTATNASNTDTLDGVHAAGFAVPGHTHDASQIVSGLLSTNLFSAYADLVAEGAIGPGANQVAAGNHTHTLYYYVGQVGTETAQNAYKSMIKQEGNINVGSGYQLVAPVTGKYYVHFQQLTQQLSGAIYLYMRKNGVDLNCSYISANSDTSTNAQRDLIVAREVTMNAGDWIGFAIESAAETACWGGAGSPHSTCSMYLIGY